MGYAKIRNLYQAPEWLQCYALEKIHGTSAHVSYRYDDGKLDFFAGGSSHQLFVGLFDQEALLSAFKSLVKPEVSDGDPTKLKAVVYGEAFGGKIMGMSKVYGRELRFIAFDVRIGDAWLDVPTADSFVKSLGLEFVPYERGPLTLEWLNSQRDLPSKVAIVSDAIREGVIIRPLREARGNNGERWIAKHKRDEFKETATPRNVSDEELKVLAEANEVAAEWVTPMRLEHVLQKSPYVSQKDIGTIIRAMADDVKAESVGEVVWSKPVERAIGRAASKLLMAKISQINP